MPKVVTYAMPAPAMPICATRSPDSGTCSTAAATSATAGTTMLPVPRSTLASVLASHTVMAPPKTMLE